MRAAVGALALGALVLALALLAQRAPADDDDQARAADAFVDSLGVNTHTYYRETAYTDFARVREKLVRLGVRHVRENLVRDRPDQYERLNALARAGIRSTLIIDPRAGTVAQELDVLRTQVLAATAAIEGPNELDATERPDWDDVVRAYQAELYAAVKADPALARLPVLAPALTAVRGSHARLGDVSAFVDFGTMHSYAGGRPPESNLENELESAARNAGDKPVMATETGYTNALEADAPPGQPPVPEDVAASYLLRTYLEYFSAGVRRTYAYELLDERPDPAKADQEEHYGLLRNDFSEKPAFVALTNLVAALSDPGPDFTPGSLAHAVTSDADDVRSLLLQKRDGSFHLVLWRQANLWDEKRKERRDVPGQRMRVTFEQPVTAVERVDLHPEARETSLSTGPALELDVGGAPVILRVTAATRTATAADEPSPPAAPAQDDDAAPGVAILAGIVATALLAAVALSAARRRRPADPPRAAPPG